MRAHRRMLRRHGLSAHDTVEVLRSKASVVCSVGILLWWAASMLFGPIWLAFRGHDPSATGGAWGSGDLP